jgi:hypothetical protein
MKIDTEFRTLQQLNERKAALVDRIKVEGADPALVKAVHEVAVAIHDREELTHNPCLN